MTNTTRLLSGACALLLTALTASAQVFVGSDNFNDNSLTAQIVDNNFTGPGTQAAGQWRFVNNNANGTGNAWTETNSRMEYTTSNTLGFNRGQLGWASPTSSSSATGGAGLTTGKPYTSSWVSTVSVTNNISGLGAGAFAAAGFEIYTTNATNSGSNGYYGLSLNSNAAGYSILIEWGRWNAALNGGAGDYDKVQTAFATTDFTDVTLRMSYDGTTKILTADYSNDNGATYLTGLSYDLAGAQAGISAPYNNGFGLEFYAAASQGVAIGSGDLSFDNFSVTAVPEPSTYAAILGACALGFVAYRRRKAA